MFSMFRHQWVAYRYKRYDLNIIENIRAETFEQIMEHYCSQGWEKADVFRSFDADSKKWSCKLRKGHQTLNCLWDRNQAGSISGMSRIIRSMAEQFSLKVNQTPSKR